jgi:Fe-S-cluster containining protein
MDPGDYTIRRMLIPLGEGHFTCQNWDPKTKLCGIYDYRPSMCRDFPIKGNPCKLKGCGL